MLFGNAAHAMLGLDGFSHVWVLFVFHDNGNRAVKALVHPPRLDGDRMGVFATRSPHRPNPIGLSLCKVRPVRRYLPAKKKRKEENEKQRSGRIQAFCSA